MMCVGLTLLLAACTRERTVQRPMPSVYYWRTTLRLDSTERAFIARHGVGRMYVRYFDVVMRHGSPMPNATIQFLDTLPAAIEVVPTVFIVENCLRHNLDSVAHLLVERIVQMNRTHDLPPPSEVQIDCDWTRNSMQRYYNFLRRLRHHLDRRGMRLSATIRLHQLTMEPPPVDEGALMVYNTGDVARGGDHNPVLDMRDVQPYLRHLKTYDLPLCAAYPIFGWQLLYRNGQFKAILRDVNLGDTTMYKPLDNGQWLVVRSSDSAMLGDSDDQLTWVNAGDHVRQWQPSSQQVLQVAQALEQQRPDINRQVIIYHLDTKYLNQYDNQFYETIYHH